MTTDLIIKQHDLFIAPNGNDNWSGTLPEPNAESTDGPLKTMTGARNMLRLRKQRGQLNRPTAVWLRDGEYQIQFPISFEADDSGPITFASYPGEQAVISGGVRITGWQEAKVNGVSAWVTDISDHLRRYGDFRSLFVNQERRSRPRLPKQGFFWIDDVPEIDIKAWKNFNGSKRFKVKAGDIQNWRNINDIDIVVMHFWIDERMRIDRFDPETRTVECVAPSVLTLTDDFSGRWAKYYVDNVFEALTEPGEWYLDRTEKKLYYIPIEGETPDTVEAVVPVVQQWLRCIGDPAAKTVDWLRFEDLTFRYTDWKHAPGLPVWYDPYRPESEWRHRDSWDSWSHHLRKEGAEPTVNYATAPQAAIHLPGSIFFEGAQNCTVENCRIEHAGFYAIDVGEGCYGLNLVGNDIYDLGGGGIKVDGGDHTAPHFRRTGNHIITDNHIRNGGLISGAAVGILLAHSFGNTVAHNEIHDLFYTGISSGWIWGEGESVSRDNLIEKNLIYDIGKGVLSDMGGIYCLGMQPGTIIRGNVIHDVEDSNYGGMGIYLDAGSSYIVVEDNVVYHVTAHPFNLGRGRENIVRNNVFAFGAAGQIHATEGPFHKGSNAKYTFTFERNIIITGVDQTGVFCPYDAKQPVGVPPWRSANNLFWSTLGKTIIFRQGEPKAPSAMLSLDDLQKKGYDVGSIVADAKLKDVANGDVTLPPDSPALKLGFIPIDTSDIGPRR